MLIAAHNMTFIRIQYLQLFLIIRGSLTLALCLAVSGFSVNSLYFSLERVNSKLAPVVFSFQMVTHAKLVIYYLQWEVRVVFGTGLYQESCAMCLPYGGMFLFWNCFMTFQLNPVTLHIFGHLVSCFIGGSGFW